MIPPLTVYGLLPPGEHSCSLEEARERFATTAPRRSLWTALLDCLEGFRRLNIEAPIIVDGSFVTDKLHPDDIELSWDVRGLTEEAQGRVIAYWLRHAKRLRVDTKVHFYPTVAGQHDFIMFFQYVGPKTAEAKRLNEKDLKGVLRISIW